MDALSSRLIKLLSQGLGVESASQQYGELHDSSCGNFIAAHYPPCPRPDLARGLRSHTDPHSLSILYQEYPGLQLLKDGKWLAIKPEAGAFVVNIGDMLQVSNSSLLIKTCTGSTLADTISGWMCVDMEQWAIQERAAPSGTEYHHVAILAHFLQESQRRCRHLRPCRDCR